MKRTIIPMIALFALLANFSSCQKADPGPAGTNGTNGANGTNGTSGTNGTNGANGTSGANGTNGTNGAGFDEAVKNGSVIIYLDGTRADGVLFKDTLRFLFSPENLDYSQAVVNSATNTQFRTRRYTGLDYSSDDNYADITFTVDTQDGTTYGFTCQLNANISTTDYKYFKVNDYLFNTDGSDFNTASFTNYSYDSLKGSLKYDFSFVVPSFNNETGSDLNVLAVVDAKVYQVVSAAGRIGGRQRNPGQIRINLHR